MPRAAKLRRFKALVGLALTAPMISACALMASLPPASGIDQRLAAFPITDAPLREPVTIYWNDHQVPFIEAANDDDLAVSLGMVHAHLRLGQLELLRLISQGRISEVAGPFTRDIDHAIRLLGFGRAVPDMIAMMPEATRSWLAHFVSGLNHYIASVDKLPHEFDVMGLDRRDWTVADILTIGRLVSFDVNWFAWSRLMPLRDRADWPDIWRRALHYGGDSVASFGFDEPTAGLGLNDILRTTGRSGSNAVVVAAGRSATGGALIASDPHLGLQLPNAWLIAGYKSPSHHAVGLMIPGLPFMALGRNPWIAWSGTNMRAASSDLYDVSDLPDDQIRHRSENVGVRWWFDRTIDIRDTAWGPILSDAAVLGASDGDALALRWLGHQASDEVTAMLRMNRARDWDQFVAALDGFSVPGQNMVFADIQGDVGQVMAVRLPQRSPDQPSDLVLKRGDDSHWSKFLSAEALPKSYRPKAGFLASANNRPAPGAGPVSYFFSPDDRIVRLRQLLSANEAVSVDDLKALQTDVYMASAVTLRDQLASRLGATHKTLGEILTAWDGHYHVDSTGALAFELLLAHLTETFYTPAQWAAVSASGKSLEILRDDIAAADEPTLRAAIATAADATLSGLADVADWGTIHRMELGHPLRSVPVIGRRYAPVDYPTAGSRQSLMKTAHGTTAARHRTAYGSNARYISDLSDLDRNYFVLLGGQDGWLGSENYVDQVALWRDVDYIQVPLQLETVRRVLTRKTVLTP